jgi:hypothetical protein
MKTLFSIIFVLYSTAASAVPVTWNFNSLLFDDGGSVDATFDFDAEKLGIDAYSNLSIVTTAGTVLSGKSYLTPDIVFASPSKIKVGNKLEVVFAGKLDQAPTNGIGVVAVLESMSGSSRVTGSGTATPDGGIPATTVPLPASLLMFLSALAGLFAYMRTCRSPVQRYE